MTNLELSNSRNTKVKELTILKPVESIANIKTAFTKIEKIKDTILDSKDIVKIKGKHYINKRGYRKLAIAFSISTEVIKEQRIERENKVFIYDFTVRASSPLGRYSEASASCASNERDFNHINNDVRATAQTRSTNRAISDLIGLGEVSYEEMINDNQSNKSNSTEQNNIVKNHIKEAPKNSTSNDDMVTQKQKLLLIKLIEGKHQDEYSRNILYKKIDSLSKQEARATIKKLIEEGVEITS